MDEPEHSESDSFPQLPLTAFACKSERRAAIISTSSPDDRPSPGDTPPPRMTGEVSFIGVVMPYRNKSVDDPLRVSAPSTPRRWSADWPANRPNASCDHPSSVFCSPPASKKRKSGGVRRGLVVVADQSCFHRHRAGMESPKRRHVRRAKWGKVVGNAGIIQEQRCASEQVPDRSNDIQVGSFA